MSDQQQHLRATGVMIIKDQPIEEGFNLFPMLLCASSQTVFYSAPLHTAPEPDTERHRSAPVPGRACAAARPAGLRLDKQRLLLAHRFAERWRRSHDIFRQIVQRHGQHFAARRLPKADATAYFTTFFSSPTLPR